MTTITKAGFSQKLYKRDTAGKVRILHVYTFGGELIQESGIVDGKLVINTKLCKIKNAGKKNEVVPAEQAILEAKSKVAEKLTEGYFNSLEELEAGADDVMLPMLAQDYHKHSSKIDWSKPVYAQPKLDGQRCLAIVKDGKVTLMSRQGKVIDTMKHIEEAIMKNLTNDNEFVLDGELYARGLNFQENMRLIKKFREGESNYISFHVYDIVTNDSYTQRNKNIELALSIIHSPYIVQVETNAISPQLLAKAHGINLGNGYEGTIIRHGDTGYEINTRSYNLLKYKDFKDMDCEVLDILPFEARPKQGVVVCKLGAYSFKANPKMSHLEREELLTNKKDYIGKIANVRYFELSEDGIPRFPVCIGFHEDR